LKDKKLTYRDAGVDQEKAQELTEFIKEKVKKAFGFDQIGGFAAGLPLEGFKRPRLLATADGVGTKLLVAQAVNVHRPVGIDLVAMNVNDLITTGARPLMFFDYVATGKLEPEVFKELLEGMIKGCKEAGVVLAGGETAEMPDFYPPGRYDLAGFCVGVAEEEELLPKELDERTLLVGLPSSGLHSNGFSLIRKVLRQKGLSYQHFLPELGKRVWEVLLEPTRIYAKEVKKLKEAGVKLKAMAHVTGGGIPENVRRLLPENLRARVYKEALPESELFNWVRELTGLPDEELFKTFNMGVGFILFVDESELGRVKELLPEAFELGRLEKGKRAVVIE